MIRQTLIARGAPAHRVRRLLNGVESSSLHKPPARIQPERPCAAWLPSGATVIGSIGRLGAEKRFDVLLRAAAKVSPRPVVVLAGDGRSRAELERLADQLGVTLYLLGHRDDVRDVYQALDVFVQSSDTEGIPNAVLEAMAMEVPIVTTDVGGTREIVEDGKLGLLVPMRDPEATARAIRRTCKDAVGRRNRVTAARARVEGELSFDTRMDRSLKQCMRNWSTPVDPVPLRETARPQPPPIPSNPNRLRAQPRAVSLVPLRTRTGAHVEMTPAIDRAGRLVVGFSAMWSTKKPVAEH